MDDLAIIGSGPAGYTAGIYAARANLEPVLFEGLESGGQLMLTTDVENYPGFDQGIMGPEMMQVFKNQAERFGTKILTETVDSIEKIENGFKLTTSKNTYEFKTVIISSGASANWLDIKGEKVMSSKSFFIILLLVSSNCLYIFHCILFFFFSTSSAAFIFCLCSFV